MKSAKLWPAFKINKNMIDYITMTIVLVITFAFCIPFVYSHQKKKKHEKRLINDFMAKAQAHQLTIDSYDLWRRSYVIGFDEARAKLLYIKFHPDFQEQLIDLKELNHIRIAKEERVLEGDAGKEKVIDKLSLSLIGNSTKSSDIQLEFYNGDENMGLMGEPLLIQKWHDRLSVALKLYKARPNRVETKQQPDLAQ